MRNIIRSESRGAADHGWLKSYHTFSFAGYHNPKSMNFRALRVINEDWVKPAEGFGTHPHHDMEIITYILSGALAHKDSMGNTHTIKAGEVQTMSAGTGITHSEFNGSDSETVHLLQMWIIPAEKGVKPKYQEWYPPKNVSDDWILVASGEAKQGVAKIERDVNLFLAKPKAGSKLELPLNKQRYGWLQVAEGEVKLGDEILKAGDAASFEKEDAISITANTNAQVLFYDLD